MIAAIKGLLCHGFQDYRLVSVFNLCSAQWQLAEKAEGLSIQRRSFLYIHVSRQSYGPNTNKLTRLSMNAQGLPIFKKV